MLSVALKFLSQAPLPPPPLPGCSVPRFHAGAFGWGRQQVLPRGPTRPAIPRHRALRSSGSRIRAPSLRQHPGGWNAGPGSPGELAVTSHGVGPCSPGVPQVNVPVRVCDWSSPDTWGAPPSSGRLTEGQRCGGQAHVLEAESAKAQQTEGAGPRQPGFPSRRGRPPVTPTPGLSSLLFLGGLEPTANTSSHPGHLVMTQPS